MTPQALIWAEIDRMIAPFEVTRADLVSPSVYRPYAWPRQMVYARLHREHGLSMSHIGRLVGGRDHTTVRHGMHQHEARMAWAEFLTWAGEATPHPTILAAMSRFTVCCKAAADRMRLAA